MGKIIRTFKQHPVEQGIGEKVAYRLTTTPWGSDPTNESVKLYLGAKDVSGECLSGSTSVTGDEIKTPLVQNLRLGRRYKLVIAFDAGGNTWKPWGHIDGKE